VTFGGYPLIEHGGVVCTVAVRGGNYALDMDVARTGVQSSPWWVEMAALTGPDDAGDCSLPSTRSHPQPMK
jgi:hypothetical protein